MDRILNIVAGGILLCLVAAIALTWMNNPYDARRTVLNERLAEAGPME
ncbi:MAG: hypothetical protein GX117_13515, partial [Candidatus Hydrogenedentes bacterium]|nr:hypothetical protein [Candidatus Hydrogenedentota bacterium]